MTLLIPSGRGRRAVTALVFGASGLVLVCGAGLGLAVASLGGGGPNELSSVRSGNARRIGVVDAASPHERYGRS